MKKKEEQAESKAYFSPSCTIHDITWNISNTEQNGECWCDRASKQSLDQVQLRYTLQHTCIVVLYCVLFFVRITTKHCGLAIASVNPRSSDDLPSGP